MKNFKSLKWRCGLIILTANLSACQWLGLGESFDATSASEESYHNTVISTETIYSNPEVIQKSYVRTAPVPAPLRAKAAHEETAEPVPAQPGPKGIKPSPLPAL